MNEFHKNNKENSYLIAFWFRELVAKGIFPHIKAGILD